jgi:hypothetical protein
MTLSKLRRTSWREQILKKILRKGEGKEGDGVRV